MKIGDKIKYLLNKKSVISPLTKKERMNRKMAKMRQDGINTETILDVNKVAWTGKIGMKKIYQGGDRIFYYFDLFKGKIRRRKEEHKLNESPLSKLQKENNPKVNRLKYREC